MNVILLVDTGGFFSVDLGTGSWATSSSVIQPCFEQVLNQMNSRDLCYSVLSIGAELDSQLYCPVL